MHLNYVKQKHDIKQHNIGFALKNKINKTLS